MTSFQISSMILAAVVWAIWFLWAPHRAYKAGVLIDDLPMTLRMQPFKIVQGVGLVVLLALAWAMPLGTALHEADWVRILGDLLQGVPEGPIIAYVALALLLFVFPMMTARTRMKKDESPGEWLTPALVYYRWFWVGLLFIFSTGLYQELYLGSFEAPMPLEAGVGLPIAAAVLFLVWWGIPSSIVAKRAGQGDPQAMHALSRVRWTGLPALLLGGAGGGGGRGSSKGDSQHKLCPSCMRPVDMVDKYESLNFEACPHCGEVIPAAFTLKEYIEHYAQRVQEIDDARDTEDKKKKAKGQQGKQEHDLVQRILRATLTLGLRSRGTDLHIARDGDQTVVRCRTDGMLFTMLEMPEVIQRLLISTIKVQCNLDITERRKPQDGSLKTVIDGRKLDVRVNTSPGPMGETASLRLLYQTTAFGSLEKMGMRRRQLGVLNEAILRPHGLVLVTGPTGSGKSTTLYNALGTIADGRRNIITLEDPIEYQVEGINQMQIDVSKDFTFSSGLRTILRQDPDVIMVGEIRDSETAKMAIDAAMTGHLVFSTLHTIDTTATIGRLQDLEVDPSRHADALLLLMAQRLLRVNCTRCATTYELTVDQLAELGLPDPPQKLVLKKGSGCEHCNGTGFFGRQGIYEMLVPRDELKEMISRAEQPARIREVARQLGMRTLLEDGLTRAVLGRTTVEEVLRVTN